MLKDSLSSTAQHITKKSCTKHICWTISLINSPTHYKQIIHQTHLLNNSPSSSTQHITNKSCTKHICWTIPPHQQHNTLQTNHTPNTFVEQFPLINSLTHYKGIIHQTHLLNNFPSSTVQHITKESYTKHICWTIPPHKQLNTLQRNHTPNTSNEQFPFSSSAQHITSKAYTKHICWTIPPHQQLNTLQRNHTPNTSVEQFPLINSSTHYKGIIHQTHLLNNFPSSTAQHNTKESYTKHIWWTILPHQQLNTLQRNHTPNTSVEQFPLINSTIHYKQIIHQTHLLNNSPSSTAQHIAKESYTKHIWWTIPIP